MAKDLPLQLGQLGPGLEAESVDELAPGRPEDLQRVGLPARPVEGEHELAGESLAERMRGHQRLELWDELTRSPGREVGVDADLERLQTLLLEPPRSVTREGLVAQVGQGGAAPQARAPP